MAYQPNMRQDGPYANARAPPVAEGYGPPGPYSFRRDHQPPPTHGSAPHPPFREPRSHGRGGAMDPRFDDRGGWARGPHHADPYTSEASRGYGSRGPPNRSAQPASFQRQDHNYGHRDPPPRTAYPYDQPSRMQHPPRGAPSFQRQDQDRYYGSQTQSYPDPSYGQSGVQGPEADSYGTNYPPEPNSYPHPQADRYGTPGGDQDWQSPQPSSQNNGYSHTYEAGPMSSSQRPRDYGYPETKPHYGTELPESLHAANLNAMRPHSPPKSPPKSPYKQHMAPPNRMANHPSSPDSSSWDNPFPTFPSRHNQHEKAKQQNHESNQPSTSPIRQTSPRRNHPPTNLANGIEDLSINRPFASEVRSRSPRPEMRRPARNPQVVMAQSGNLNPMTRHSEDGIGSRPRHDVPSPTHSEPAYAGIAGSVDPNPYQARGTDPYRSDPQSRQRSPLNPDFPSRNIPQKFDLRKAETFHGEGHDRWAQNTAQKPVARSITPQPWMAPGHSAVYDFYGTSDSVAPSQPLSDRPHDWSHQGGPQGNLYGERRHPEEPGSGPPNSMGSVEPAHNGLPRSRSQPTFVHGEKPMQRRNDGFDFGVPSSDHHNSNQRNDIPLESHATYRQNSPSKAYGQPFQNGPRSHMDDVDPTFQPSSRPGYHDERQSPPYPHQPVNRPFATNGRSSPANAMLDGPRHGGPPRPPQFRGQLPPSTSSSSVADGQYPRSGQPSTSGSSFPSISNTTGRSPARSNMSPDALPSHPAPVRPGLTMGQGAAGHDRPAPVRQYNGSGENLATPQSQSGDLRGKVAPVTYHELENLRQQTARHPNDNSLQLQLAKRLAEASGTLVDEKADQATRKRNRDKFNQDALRILRKLSTLNYAEGDFFYADCYSRGVLGLQADIREAFNLYQKAAKGNHAQAAYRVAVCCEIGQEEGGGTKKDPVKAIQWYKRAATLGDVAAMYKMGVILLKGLLGQPRDPREAIVWLNKAVERADKENPHALHEMGLLHEKPTSIEGIRQDESRSRELFLQAANLGYKFSQFRLGAAFEYGQLGCPVDPRQSIAWYSKAAMQEEHQSELALSGWYLTGAEGVLQQSDTEAYLWARKSAHAGLAKAEYAMGYFTEVGIGAPANLEDAKRWYWKSASQNFPKARERLEDLRRGGAPKAKARVSRSNMKKQSDGECVVM